MDGISQGQTAKKVQSHPESILFDFSTFQRFNFSAFQLFNFSTFAFLGRKVESCLTIVRSKTSTFRLFEVTFLLEKWKLVCLISTFRVPRRSKSGWRKQDSVFGADKQTL